MNYELAKQLKEARFPFHECNLGEMGSCESIHCSQVLNDSHYCDPTLSELIEACGSRFFSLNRHEGGCFVAVAIGDNLTSFIRTENANKSISPEEAVANLWLALNKK